MNEEIGKLAMELQNDCHKLTKDLVKRNPKLSHQDATNVWLFKKLAELELRLREAELPTPVIHSLNN